MTPSGVGAGTLLGSNVLVFFVKHIWHFAGIICVCQKKAVPLHAKSSKDKKKEEDDETLFTIPDRGDDASME